MNTFGTSSNYAGLMAGGSHDAHRGHCTHPNVAFCAPCRATYCRDCSQEWTAPVVVYHDTTGAVANCLTNAPTAVANSCAGHG